MTLYCGTCVTPTGEPCLFPLDTPKTAGVGTVANFASIAELRDLIKAKDYTLDQLGKAYKAFEPSWVTKDSSAQQDWLADWKALLFRYDGAHAKAEAAIFAAKAVPLDDRLIPAQIQWDAVLRSIRKNWDGHTGGELVKGDLQDLNNRLQSAQSKPIDYSNMPQPVIGSDADLNLFQAADVTIKKGFPTAAYVALALLGSIGIGYGIYFAMTRTRSSNPASGRREITGGPIVYIERYENKYRAYFSDGSFTGLQVGPEDEDEETGSYDRLVDRLLHKWPNVAIVRKSERTHWEPYKQFPRGVVAANPVPETDLGYAQYRKQVLNLLLYQGTTRSQAARLIQVYTSAIARAYEQNMAPAFAVHAIVNDRGFMKVLVANPVRRKIMRSGLKPGDHVGWADNRSDWLGVVTKVWVKRVDNVPTEVARVRWDKSGYEGFVRHTKLLRRV